MSYPRRKEEKNNMSKVWLITGSARGIGRHVVEAALSAGDHVVATARNPERLHELMDRYGDRIRTVQQDVRDASAAATAVQTAADAFGRIDVVVHAARSAEPAVEDFEVNTFRIPVETNLFGFVYVTQAALPILRQQGDGHVIQISPEGSRINFGSFSAHQISKQAVERFAVEFARDVAPLGIKVTIVETGRAHNDGFESSAPLVTGRHIESVVRPTQPINAHDTQEPNDSNKVARLILWTAGMAEPPLRLLVGSEASQRLVDAGDVFAASWRH
jgi:NAD(P)-dependent dehydrogenase (short-subunit alcohol dehydrogenase family)